MKIDRELLMKSVSVRALLVAASLVIVGCAAYGQKSPVPDSILGDWYGESKCTVPSSPCKDEIVIYHMTRLKDAPGKVHWAADKVVNGKPEAMGELDFDYDATKSEMKGEFKIPRTGGNAVWLFKIDGDKMHGTLTSDNELYRKVEVSRKKPGS